MRTIIRQRLFGPPAFLTIALVVFVSLSTFSFAVSRSTSSLLRRLFWQSSSSLMFRLICPSRSTELPRDSKLSSCSFIRRSYRRPLVGFPPLSSSSYSPVGRLLYFCDIIYPVVWLVSCFDQCSNCAYCSCILLLL